MRFAQRLSLFYMVCLFGLPATAFALSVGPWQVVSQPDQPFRASAELLLDKQETVQSLSMGSANDYGVAKVPRLPIIQQITPRIEQQGGRSVIWLESQTGLGNLEQDLFLLLHITSNQRTYLPFLRIRSATPPNGERAQENKKAVAGKEGVQAAGQRRQYGPVRRGETLASIALGFAKAARVTVWQAQVAIWQRNTEQFSLNNMNGLKVGGLLTIPEPAEMAQIDPQMAATLRTAHIAEWKKPLSQREPAPSSLLSSSGAVETAPTLQSKQSPAARSTEHLPSNRTPRANKEQGTLEQILSQLQTIHTTLEKNQGQLDQLVQRVSNLENGQKRVDEISQRLFTLEEMLKMGNRPE